MSAGYIYIVDLKPMDLPGFKIGTTRNLDQRMKQLHVPEKATLCHWFWVQDARECEKVLHKLYPKHRVPQSEWFKISNDQKKLVVKRIRQWKADNPKPSATKKLTTYQTRSPKSALPKPSLDVQQQPVYVQQAYSPPPQAIPAFNLTNVFLVGIFMIFCSVIIQSMSNANVRYIPSNTTESTR